MCGPPHADCEMRCCRKQACGDAVVLAGKKRPGDSYAAASEREREEKRKSIIEPGPERGWKFFIRWRDVGQPII